MDKGTLTPATLQELGYLIDRTVLLVQPWAEDPNALPATAPRILEDAADSLKRAAKLGMRLGDVPGVPKEVADVCYLALELCATGFVVTMATRHLSLDLEGQMDGLHTWALGSLHHRLLELRAALSEVEGEDYG